jgi:hypothetical protein
MENNKEFKFNAGEMKIIEGKAKANLDKGEIRIYFNPEIELTCFEWKNLTKNTITEPIMLTPGDWKWEKIPSKKGLIYSLQNTHYNDEKHIFYMQFNKDLDEQINKKAEKIINSGEIENDNNKKEEQNVPMNINEINNNNNNNVNNNNQNNMDFISRFTQTIKLLTQKYPKLSDILTRERIINVYNSLNEEKKQDLIKLLPANQQNTQGFHNNIKSPQFLQALGQLESALNSENLQAIIQSFKLDLNVVQKYSNGVEAFIRGIIEKYKKKDENEKK